MRVIYGIYFYIAFINKKINREGGVLNIRSVQVKFQRVSYGYHLLKQPSSSVKY